MMIRAGHMARIGEKRNAYKLLVGKPNNMKLDLGEVESCCECGNEPSGS
jgi:hypothetical protein